MSQPVPVDRLLVFWHRDRQDPPFPFSEVFERANTEILMVGTGWFQPGEPQPKYVKAFGIFPMSRNRAFCGSHNTTKKNEPISYRY
jgi:hypothetical protein